MKKFLIISPNGYGNVGDDICAYAGAYLVRRVHEDSLVKVSSPPMNKKLVEWADVVILSGGGIIYDRDWPNVDNYLNYIDYAHELGKKSAVLGVGVQGIVTDKGKKRYLESLNKCEFVSVRTPKDKKMLDDIGFKNAIATYDIAFWTPEMLENNSESLVNKLKKAYKYRMRHQAKNKIRVGLCLIDLKKLKKKSYGPPFSEIDARIEDLLSNKHPDTEFFLIQNSKEDGEMLRNLARKYNCVYVPYTDIKDIGEFYKLYGSLDLLFGVRLHSLALAIMAGVPTAGMGSSGAKQFRFANFNLTSLQKQFYPFSEKDRIVKFIDSLKDPSFIKRQKKLSDKEYSFIEQQKQKNEELIKSL